MNLAAETTDDLAHDPRLPPRWNLRFPALALALTGLMPLTTLARTPPAATPAVATTAAASAAQAELVREVSADTGKDPVTLNALLDGAVVEQSIIDAMNRPAEGKPWSQYRPIFLTPERIAEGVSFYQRHRALLEQVSQQYGVPSQLIVAIIGVETDYGANTGSYRVLDALVTLAFHYPPREKYFRGELKTLLELPADKLPGPIPDIHGSYAGAEGLAQFMPSSIRDFAVDEDGDGHINLMASLPDAFASIANYFRAHGWQTGQPVAVQADPSATAAPPPTYPDAMPDTPLEQFTADGYAPTAKEDPGRPANLLTLDGPVGPQYWLTFRNFYVITRYNRSPLYAMAVSQLAEAISDGVDSSTDAQ
ncbi:MAG TPA: lytic murein transglycosylase B [Rhodanobacteraceae bacterium]|nr:lytic murein transglycosylase B [Rhodanobacteraceae bacterium]